MKKALVMAVAVVMAAMGLQAQIPAEVTNVMNKCRAAMNNPAGLEYVMDMKSSMGPVKLLDMNIVNGSKGEKSKSIITMKVLGQEIIMEAGFDGTQEWDADQDTVIITKTTKRKKDKTDLQLEPDKKYRKARMKEKDDFYEIVFTDPIDRQNEAKKITAKVSKKNYYIREIKSGARGATVNMTISKIRIGLKDDYFKLDLGKYPNAVVVKK